MRPAFRPCRALCLAFALAGETWPAEPAQQDQVGPVRGLAEGVRQVQTLYGQRRYQDAARIAEGLVREHRDNAEAWLALCTVHLASDWAFRRDARAESAALRALKLTGRRPDVLSMLAMARHRLGKYDEALSLIAELADCKPPLVSGEALADLLAVRADVELRREVDDPEARGRALRDLDRAVAAAPALASVRSLRAEIAIQDGRFDAALADLQVAVTSAPGSKMVHYQLQTCLARLGRREESRHHHEIWRRLNRLTDSQGATNAPSPEERRKLLRELKELQPGDLLHRLDLARVELELGANDAALAECEAILALAPGWPPALHLRDEAGNRAAAAQR